MVLKPNDPRKWPKKIKPSPVGGLKTEEQFKKISSSPRTKWITDTLDLGKATNVKINPGDNYYNPPPYSKVYNRSDHTPFSDWSAKENYEYYNNLLDLEIDWGKPTYHRPPRPFDPPKWKPGYTPIPEVLRPTGGPWGEIEASHRKYQEARRKAYEQAFRQPVSTVNQMEFWGVDDLGGSGVVDWVDWEGVLGKGFFGILKELKELKDNYWTWSTQKVLVAWGNIRYKLDSLNVRQKSTSYYYKATAELNARLDAIQSAFRAYTLTRDYGWWALIYIIFLFSLTISSIAIYERIAQANYVRTARPRFNFEFGRSDLDPIGDLGGYDLTNPPSIEFPEFVYTPPPVKDLIVKPDFSPVPFTRPYTPWTFKPVEYGMGQSTVFSPVFKYPEPEAPDKPKEFPYVWTGGDLAVIPKYPTGLSVIPRPSKEVALRVNWQDFLPPMSWPGLDKPIPPTPTPVEPPAPNKPPRTIFGVYREEIASILTGVFNLTILPWVGLTPPKEHLPVGATISPFVRRLNDWLGTHYHDGTWEMLSPETKASLKNQLNRRIYFLELINENLFEITEEQWLSLNLWEKQDILDQIGAILSTTHTPMPGEYPPPPPLSTMERQMIGQLERIFGIKIAEEEWRNMSDEDKQKLINI